MGDRAPLISSSGRQRHQELFEGTTTDGGTNWTWKTITVDSGADNIRPIVPTWDGDHTALLWLRGTYTTCHDYNLDAVGIISVEPQHAPPTATDTP